MSVRCETTHFQIIATADTLIDVDNRRVSVPKGISVLEVKPGWMINLPAGVSGYNLPANAFFFSRSSNDKEFQLLKDKLDLITSNIAVNQSVISSQLSALAADVAEIKATGAKSAEVSAIISRLDDSVTLSQFNELSGQLAETKTNVESLFSTVESIPDNYLKISDYESGIIPPVGFVYAQYPGMLSPWDLYIDVQSNWTERFNNEGVFFRTPGRKASKFGSGIQEDALQYHEHNIPTSFDDDNGGYNDIGSSMNASNGTLGIRNSSGHEAARVAEETRPRNRTFRIWEKTRNG